MSLKHLFSWSATTEPKGVKTVYDFTAQTLSHEPLNFMDLRGKVLLIVNVASFCGFTPQYTGLQELHSKFHDKGLEIIGFPCNQFGRQEPGSNEEIHQFCSSKYDVGFRIMDKVDVNGEHTHPLYKFLKSERSSLMFEAIKWNFEKFLIRRDGTVYQRYLPLTTPAALEADIVALLAEPAPPLPSDITVTPVANEGVPNEH